MKGWLYLKDKSCYLTIAKYFWKAVLTELRNRKCSVGSRILILYSFGSLALPPGWSHFQLGWEIQLIYCCLCKLCYFFIFFLKNSVVWECGYLPAIITPLGWLSAGRVCQRALLLIFLWRRRKLRCNYQRNSSNSGLVLNCTWEIQDWTSTVRSLLLDWGRREGKATSYPCYICDATVLLCFFKVIATF